MLPFKTSAIACFLTIIWMFCRVTTPALGQPVVVLRDFAVPASPVERIDEDGIYLQDGTLIAWDRVSQITVNQADQPRVDQMLHSLGRPLFQIRWRLEIGDFVGAQRAAETIREAILPRGGPGALLIHLADMANQVEQGSSANAALYWIQALELLKKHPTWRDSLPQNVEIPSAPELQLHPQIFPIWTSAQAKEAWPRAESLLTHQALENWSLTTQVYLIAMAIDAKELAAARRMLKDLNQKSPAWTEAFEKRLQAQSSLKDSEQLVMSVEAADWSSEIKAVTTYWIASEALASSNRATSERAAIDLLSIPALYQRQYPQLAAAALAAVAQRQREIGDEVSAQRLYNEIQRNYEQTNVSRRLTKLKQQINEQTNAKSLAPGN